jgi:predicted lysophospholipase L1 biosynthesis ABC-type transport system permease subunit
VRPAILEGRAPRAPDEVALGTVTLRDLGKRIGDHVEAGGPGARARFRVVGRAVFPTLGQPQPVADGAAFTPAGFAPLFDRNNYYRYLVGRLARDDDRAAVERQVTTEFPQLFETTGPSVPTEIERLQQVNWFPATIAVLLGALALLAVGHALVTSLRRHRGDLAMLKTLGFTRSQIRATVAWQATTVAVVGLTVGIPVGLALGHLAWTNIADDIGVSTTTTFSVLIVAVTVPVALLLVNLVALLPARAAARTRPAVALRAD